jgi:hypothetical protein
MLLAGACAWIVVFRLLRKMVVNMYTAWFFGVTLFVVLLSWSLIYYTPDLPALALWLCAFDLLVSQNRFRHVALAITGVLLYFCKSYNLFFFPLLTWIWYYRHGNIRTILLITTLFVAGCIPWIVLLSSATGHFTTGTAGPVNIALAWINGSQLHPIFTNGLMPLPDSLAVSAWDEPNPDDYPLLTRASLNLTRIAWHIVNQAWQLMLILLKLCAVPVVLTGWVRWRNISLQPGLVFLLSLACLFTGGYLLTWVVERYIWLTLITLIMAGFVSYEKLVAGRSKNMHILCGLLLTCCVTAIPLRRMFVQQQKNKTQHEAITILSGLPIPSGCLVASDHDLFAPTLYMCLLTGRSYAGITEELPLCNKRHPFVQVYFSRRKHASGSNCKAKEINHGDYNMYLVPDEAMKR